jgi:hypothetical protein
VGGWLNGWMDGWMSQEMRYSRDEIHQSCCYEYRLYWKWLICMSCLLFLLLRTFIHPSIHLSIYVISPWLFNISMAPFNNPPDQLVSKTVHFEGSNWLVRWIVEISTLHSLEFGTQTFYTIHPSVRPSIYSVIHFLISPLLLSTIHLTSPLLPSKWTGLLTN